MAFQIKDFVSICASMINHAKATQTKITDFNAGSVARTLIESPAIEIEELYQKMFIGLKEAIPTAIYLAFDFTLQPAVSASGLLHITITPQATDTVIPAGTVFRVAGVQVAYVSAADAIIAAGDSFADVFVSSTTSGVAGNVVSGLSFTPTPSIYAMLLATNQAAFTNGKELETEDQRKSRFAAFIVALSRGTVAALRYGLSLVHVVDSNGTVIESVQTSSIIEPYLTDSNQPIAWVKCYIHNGSSGASSQLLTRAIEVIHGYYDVNGVAVPGWKAAGVKVDIYAASVIAIDVTGVVTVLAGYVSADVKQSCVIAVTQYIQSLPIGTPAILSEIIAIIMNVEGVYNVTLSAPLVDEVADNTQKLMPGTITLS